MSKSSKKYEVVLSNGLTYNAFSLPEAKRVYEFLRVAFPSYNVCLNVRLM